MERRKAGDKPQQADRAARLKAALKANLGRRKAQARARTGDTAGKPAASSEKEE